MARVQAVLVAINNKGAAVGSEFDTLSKSYNGLDGVQAQALAAIFDPIAAAVTASNGSGDDLFVRATIGVEGAPDAVVEATVSKAAYHTNVDKAVTDAVAALFALGEPKP